MHARFILGLLMLVAGSVMHVGTQAGSALAQPDDSALIVVVEDRTAQAECTMWIDSPTNEVPCSPGSVLIARRTTYRDVQRAGLTHYAVLTGNQQHDVRIERELVATVSTHIRRQSMQPTACAEGWPWAGGSYLSIPDNPASTKITYELKYHRRVDCVIDSISDRARTNGPALGWQVSCVNKNQDCTQRGVVMDANWQPRNGAFFNMAFNSLVGREYWHIATAPCWNCGNPYGIFPLR